MTTELEKPRKFRDRRTHEQITKQKLADQDRQHPVRKPYQRGHKNWLTIEEEDDNLSYRETR